LACDVTESTAKGRMFAPSEQDRSGHDAVMSTVLVCELVFDIRQEGILLTLSSRFRRREV
jgi:hypothetical protein